MLVMLTYFWRNQRKITYYVFICPHRRPCRETKSCRSVILLRARNYHGLPGNCQYQSRSEFQPFSLSEIPLREIIGPPYRRREWIQSPVGHFLRKQASQD